MSPSAVRGRRSERNPRIACDCRHLQPHPGPSHHGLTEQLPSLVESLRIDSARDPRPASTREVPRVGHRGERPRSSRYRWWPVCQLWSACPLPRPCCPQRRPIGQLASLPARDTQGAASLLFFATDAGNPRCPASDAAFRESLRPQRRGLLPLRERRCWCRNQKRLGEHRYIVPVSPIRRHLLDPQRRKSSIIPSPTQATMAFDGGPITSAFLPPVARLRGALALPFLHRISRPSSNMWFKTPAVVSHRTSMFSQLSGGELLEENASVGPASRSISV